jgi:hydrogenase maturation protein HypF
MQFKKIALPFKLKKPVLALGGQTKNTVCFAQDSLALLSPVHADLSIPKDYLSFKKDAGYFLKRRPEIIACDLHPEYLSSKFGSGLRLKAGNLAFVQHHHAHIASCMAENRLKNQRVIGVAFDGTGLGSDNTLWGAEFLDCDYKGFRRMAHLKTIPLLGSEKAILEPWRLTAAWLDELDKNFLALPLEFNKKIDKRKWQALKDISRAGFNSPLASSMGRLFDAVASLVFAKHKVDYEAQLAIELEKAASGYTQKVTGYKFKIYPEQDQYILDPLQIFKGIIADLVSGAERAKIAYRFHLSVAEMILETCRILKSKLRINKVVFSGGVFQNKLLLSLSQGLLCKQGFKVFTHSYLSPNDSSLSLGQVVIANFQRLKCA